MTSSEVEPEAPESRTATFKRLAFHWAHWAIPAALYLAGGFFIMARAWVRGPASFSLCACGDKALFLWMMEWPAHAIAHLQNPFFSTAAMHPHGVNLLDATSVMGLSIPLVPVTWLFGPVFSLNVALTLCPALSALAAYGFVRRFTKSWIVAMVGGGIYGFSSYVVTNVGAGALMLAAAFVLPLLAICFDDLARTHKWAPWRVGVAIGLLMLFELFVSSEMTLLYAIGLSVAGLLLLAYNLAHDRTHLRDSVTGLGVGALASGVLLALPVTFALLGPEHLSGPAWGTPTYILGNEWTGLVSYSRAASPRWHWVQVTAGWFEQPLPPAAYLGWGVVAAAGAGLIAGFRHVSRWALAVGGLLALLLSLGAFQFMALWGHFYRLPLLDSVIQGRLIIITILFAAALACLGVEGVGETITRRISDDKRRDFPRRIALGVAGFGVASVSLVAIWPSIPLGVRHIEAPPWFAKHGSSMSQGSVILPNPPAFSTFEDPLAWQALDAMRWSQPGIAGPQALASRSGRQGPAVTILQKLAFGAPQIAPPTQRAMSEVRQAMRRWRITDVVVPLEFGTAGMATAPAAAFYTAALGVAPRIQDDAWTWSITPHSWSAPPLTVTKQQFVRCAREHPRGTPMDELPACIIRSAHSVTSSR